MTPQAPTLLLDSEIHAPLGETGLLPFWVHNTTGTQLTKLRVSVAVSGNSPDLDIYPAGANHYPVADSQILPLQVNFLARRAGRYPLQVSLEAHNPQSGWRYSFHCAIDINLVISNNDAQGKVNMTFEKQGVLQGYLPPGNYRFVDAMVVQSEQGVLPSQSSPSTKLALAAHLPPEDRCIRLPLRLAPVPGLDESVPDLAMFAKHWKDSGGAALESFQFVDKSDWVRIQPARVKDAYRLQLRSFRGGQITLLVQGSSGRFFQLAPHQHWGQQIIAGNQSLLFPDQILTNVSMRDPATGPLPDDFLGVVPFGHTGTERALAIVSPQPFAEELAIFNENGKEPNLLDKSEVHRLLTRINFEPDVELGYTDVEVLQPLT